MTIHFQPRFSGPPTPNTPRPLAAGQRTDPGQPLPTVSTDRPSSSEPTPLERMQALVEKMQNRLEARMGQGDLDAGQLKNLGEMMRTFEGALAALGDGAMEGLYNEREVASGVQRALTAFNSGVQDVIQQDVKDPGPVRTQGGPTGAARTLDAQAGVPYTPVDRRA